MIFDHTWLFMNFVNSLLSFSFFYPLYIRSKYLLHFNYSLNKNWPISLLNLKLFLNSNFLNKVIRKYFPFVLIWSNFYWLYLNNFFIRARKIMIKYYDRSLGLFWFYRSIDLVHLKRSINVTVLRFVWVHI